MEGTLRELRGTSGLQENMARKDGSLTEQMSDEGIGGEVGDSGRTSEGTLGEHVEEWGTLEEHVEDEGTLNEEQVRGKGL